MNHYQLMPLLFVGHGSPMNGIANNDFTQMLTRLGQRAGVPRAVLCISAHWTTANTQITAMSYPKTIHDFYGFPAALFQVQYPAPGDPSLAQYIKEQIVEPIISLDEDEWGLDHGCWSVLKHMYPEATVPVVQLSINLAQPGEYHFKLGQALRFLRSEGILIVGSGNIVHNLQLINWDINGKPYPWAIETDELIKRHILSRNFQRLIQIEPQLSIPTAEHYYPLLYVLGAATEDEHFHFEYEQIVYGSISMRTLSIGLHP